jgi:hypothetical protein
MWVREGRSLPWAADPVVLIVLRFLFAIIAGIPWRMSAGVAPTDTKGTRREGLTWVRENHSFHAAAAGLTWQILRRVLAGQPLRPNGQGLLAGV